MLSLRKLGSQTFRLVSALTLLTFALFDLHVGMSTPTFYTYYFGEFDANHAPSFLFLIAFSFTCFFILPALFAKVIFRQPLAALGLRLPHSRIKTVLLISMAMVLLVPSIYLLSRQADFRAFYSMRHPSMLRLAFMLSLMPIYYFAEEFFFRGFLFLGLWQRIGWHSFWLTEIIFTLSHINKPVIEILLCIPVSVIFNCLSLYTRSFYPAFIVHTTIGTFCLLYINWHHITLF